ncbi:MAG TPA: hypothetical protein VGQ35_00650 [Dongiaceae bacterium]|jgi:hypothetical protein|nr:hypothetical protein [Dongiaceae bacterium]
MLRFLGFATLVLIAVCLAVSASIALADDGLAPSAATVQDRAVEAVDPDRRMIDDSLVSIEDVYEFDFAVKSDAEPNPEYDEPSDILEI